MLNIKLTIKFEKYLKLFEITLKKPLTRHVKITNKLLLILNYIHKSVFFQ